MPLVFDFSYLRKPLMGHSRFYAASSRSSVQIAAYLR